MTRPGKHALVFGATGLLGWGIVNELLSDYPEPGTFSKVTAVTNRPLSVEDSFWPVGKGGLTTPELQVASGIDLLRNGSDEEDDLAAQLKECVTGIEGVTQIFYFAFSTYAEDFEEECRINCGMMRRVVGAVKALCPKLESFVYGGGTRGYGIYIPGGTFTAPLREELAGQLPADYKKTVAYPWFRDITAEASASRQWSWTEVCPDAVVGFSPIGSGYSLALHWAQYLSLYAFRHGTGAEVAFPGSEAGMDALFTPVSTRTLGRIAVFAALNGDRCGGKVVNAVDDAAPSKFRELWPRLASWFGLVGVGPRGGDGEVVVKPSEYIEENRHLFAENGRPRGVSCGVGVGSKQLDSVGYWLSFDRQLSGERLRSVGFEDTRPPVDGWIEAFERFGAAGIIF